MSPAASVGRSSSGTVRRGDMLAGRDLANVIQGELLDEPGTQIGQRLPPERALALRFSVSRPLVREALRVLADRGLITVQPGRGSFVKKMSALDAAQPLHNLLRRQHSTARQLVVARSMLEAEAASTAATRGDERAVAKIAESLAATTTCPDIIATVWADLAFHARIVQAAGNPIIETMFIAIARQIAELMLRTRSDVEVSRVGLPYHEEIYEAIRTGDADGARRAVIGHLHVGERMLGPDFDKPLEDVARTRLRHYFGDEFMLEELLNPPGSVLLTEPPHHDYERGQ